MKMAMFFLAASLTARVKPSGDYRLVLPQHTGLLTWTAPDFEAVQPSAKPAGVEMGVRAKDSKGRCRVEKPTTRCAP
jgi:hypothetical protein